MAKIKFVHLRQTNKTNEKKNNERKRKWQEKIIKRTKKSKK